MTPVDLSEVQLADNHCHGIYRIQAPADVDAWRGLFTESRDPGMRNSHVTTTLFYRRLLRELASFFDCEPTEEAILTVRSQFNDHDLVRSFLRAANFEVLFIDKGYPSPDQLLSDVTVSELANCRVAPMLRVELVMQDLIAQHTTLSAVIEALQAALADVRG